MQLFRQLALRANAVLQQKHSQQPLGSDRRPPFGRCGSGSAHIVAPASFRASLLQGRNLAVKTLSAKSAQGIRFRE
jgi:hypothetical protein